MFSKRNIIIFSVLALAIVSFIYANSKQNAHIELMDRGFCEEQQRYLSVDEIVDQAISGLITRTSYEFHNLDSVSQGRALYTSPDFVKFSDQDWNNIYQYKSVPLFKIKNPTCCELVFLPPGSKGKVVSYLQHKPYLLVNVKFKDLKKRNYKNSPSPSAEVWVEPCGRTAIIRFSNSIFSKP